MKRLISMATLTATALLVTSCGNWWNSCCDPCCEPCPKPCPPQRCVEQRPHCCPQPHIWDDACCDPSNYELN